MKLIKIPRYGLILIILFSFLAGVAFDTWVFYATSNMKQKEIKKEIKKWEEEYKKNETEMEMIENMIDSIN